MFGLRYYWNLLDNFAMYNSHKSNKSAFYRKEKTGQMENAKPSPSTCWQAGSLTPMTSPLETVDSSLLAEATSLSVETFFFFGGVRAPGSTKIQAHTNFRMYYTLCKRNACSHTHTRTNICTYMQCSFLEFFEEVMAGFRRLC